jgi:polysaccharide export outer membrane protein
LREELQQRLSKYLRNPQVTVIITKYNSRFGDKDRVKTQSVRPDGKIDFPLAGAVQASGLTVDELREELQQRLSKYLRSPQVTVIIAKYNSKKVSVLGEVKTPGLLRLSSDINLLEAISRAGGLTDDADLEGSLLVREGKILPLSFEKLLRRGDFSQNVPLEPNDVILLPNIKDKKVFILGEVKKSLVATLKPGVTLIEAVSMAEGFTPDAQRSNVLIIRGGLGSPKIMEINVDEITKREQTVPNVQLQAGDIVYVPKTLIANVAQFFNYLRDIISPIVLAGTGITLYPTVKSVLTTGQGTQQGIAVGP